MGGSSADLSPVNDQARAPVAMSRASITVRLGIMIAFEASKVGALCDTKLPTGWPVAASRTTLLGRAGSRT